MHARLTGLIAAALVAAAAPFAAAQTPAPTTTATATPLTFISAAEVQALMAKAARERRPDQGNFVQTLERLAPYSANLEYRGAVGPAAVHEKEAELFYVIEGGGTLVTGGRLTGESRTNATNLSGTGVSGGESRKVGKGDFMFVAEGVPHWFSAIDGRLVMMSLHVPRDAH